MQIVGSDPWSIGAGHDSVPDFCVWTLERDGLRVPPFDRHPDGDGRLRAAGVDAAAWRAWLADAVAACRAWERRLMASRPPDLTAIGPPVFLERHWRGDRRIADLLAEMADVYWRTAHNDRSRAVMARWPDYSPLRDLARGRMFDPTLWNALRPYHAAIPGKLSIAFVAYPGPLTLALPPSTLLLGMLGWRPDRAESVRAVVAGAEELAVRNRAAER